jgi:hypothetical protein
MKQLVVRMPMKSDLKFTAFDLHLTEHIISWFVCPLNTHLGAIVDHTEYQVVPSALYSAAALAIVKGS